MKIPDIEVITIQYHSKMVHDDEGHSHPGPAHDALATLTHILTDEGVEGYSTGGSPRMLPLARQVLIGEDPLYRERIWQRLRQFQRMNSVALNDLFLSAIAQALWERGGGV